MKPDVVFFGEKSLEQADAMLVVGSANLGQTCADDLLAANVEDRCETALSFLL